MFTGIVEELGAVASADGRRMVVSARKVVEESEPGSSVSVNGVCLTVVAGDEEEGTLGFDLSEETLARTALGGLSAGAPVNLERPVTLLTRLGGHMVQGHVDAVGVVAVVTEVRGGVEMEFEIPPALRRYVVPKGSIAVDGVSLTVTEARDGRFGVALVPHTLAVTTFGSRQVGDRVNLEVDVLAKYVEALIRRDV
jgi:riboflavin synthase